MSRVAYVVACDIADDERREDVAMFLPGYGPRVQLSVFEAELPDPDAAQAFRDRLRAMTGRMMTRSASTGSPPETMSQRVIYGARRIEERMDFWIV